MVEFIRLREEHLEQVLKWRTKENITKYMNTDIKYDLEQQYKWFWQVDESETEKYWVISIKDGLVGLIYVTDIDFINKRTSWGYYIGEEKYQMYGAIIPLYLYYYVFEELQLHKITAEVMRENENVVKLNKMHGCREVGTYYDHVYKNGRFHDVVLMELLKEDWQENKRNFKYKANFEQ